MNHFEHDYIVPDEFRPDATILCMRCGKKIASPSYRMMKMKNEPSREVAVYDRKIHNDYRLVPLYLSHGARKGMMHIFSCAACSDFNLTQAVANRIKEQIVRAFEIQAKFMGRPKFDATKIREQEIVGRGEVQDIQDIIREESF